MKLRYVIGITLVVCIISMGIGLYNKNKYKDFNDEEEPLTNFTVGLLSEELVEAQIKRMNESLEENAAIIAAVKCEEKTKFLFSCETQKVTVEKVFKGTDVNVGESIDVAKSGGFIYSDGYGDGHMSINTGFVNEMIPGKSYLVFIEKKLDNADLYIIDSDMIIKPVFCYDDITNVPVQSLSDEADYTLYSNVKDNEFFFDAQKSYEMMNEFKEKLFARYPVY